MKISLLFFSIVFLVNVQLLAQRGKNGSHTVTAANAILNSYTSLTSNASAGQSVITVASNSMVGGFFNGVLTPGDLILIVQMQGASMNVDTYAANEFVTSNGQFWGPYTTPIGHLNDWNQHIQLWGEILNYNNAGKFELAEVRSLAGANSISLMCPLVNNYSISGRVQIVRVPRFVNLTINSNTSAVPTPWNGTVGGVVAVEVDGTLTLNANGSISASGSGFRGGVTEDQTLGSPPGNVNDIGFCASHVATQGAEKGESIAGFYTEYDAIYSRYCKSAPANGGGGGNNHNAGGGGGCNVGNTALTYTGKGVPNPTYNVNWNLESAGMGGSVSPGGGRGGYSGATVNQNENTVGPNNTSWGGDYRRKEGGLGGHPLAQDNTRIFAGGGGGAGDQNNGQGGGGGRGGGIAFVKVYGSIVGSGTIEANGANGINANPNGQTAVQASTQKFGIDGAGGAGGGGTVYVSNSNPIPNTVSISAKGGDGGNQVLSIGLFAPNPQMEADGPGGGGGGGYVSITSGNPTINVNGGIAGTTNSTHVPNFPQNGATGGHTGISTTNSSAYDIIAANDTICGNGSVTLTASTIGNPPAGSLTWYSTPFGTTAVGTGNSFTTPVLNSTTTYYIGICPGSFRKAVTVVVGSAPTISGNAVITNATCLNPGSITGLSVNGGAQPYSYSWSNNGGNTLNLTNAAAGSYTLTVSDAAGCSSNSGPYQINGTSGPILDTTNLTISPVLCNGTLGSINGITANGNGLTYSWSNGGGNAVNATNLSVGNYTLTVTDGNGCTSSTLPINVPQIAGPSIDGAAVTYSTAFCGQATGGISGISTSGQGLQYLWTPGNSTSMNLSNVSAGTYTLVAMDQNGCTDTLGPLTVPGDIALNLDSANMQVLPALCGQNNGVINGIALSGGTAPYSFLWSNQSVNLNPSGLSPGSYTLYVTDANGCMDSITGIVVGAFGGPSIDTSQMVINPVACDGTLGSITGITSPSPGVSYGWSNQGNTADLSNLTSGMYQLTLTDANGCTSSYNFVVNQNNPVTIDQSQALVTNATCLMNGSISGLSVSGGTNNYTYSWQPGNLSTLNISNLPAGTSYVLTVTDANGCSDTSNLYTIGTPNYPVASFTYSPAIPNLGDSVTFTNTSSNYTSEQWINAGITVNQPSPWSYSYTAGTFQVTLTVTNNEGCTDTVSAFVTVYDQIQVPNVFSPNNDMINDVLTIQSLKPGTSLTILNRWGNVVYYSESYANNWDGKDQNGNDVSEGVYTIILTDLQKTMTSYYFIHLTR
jgi:gliding motility-associated-like protein